MSTPTLAHAQDALTTHSYSPQLFNDRNFRWLFGGATLSMLGDQFTLIALPWLILQMTRDPLALSGALVAIALPRALMVLFGGALVDRHSPRRVLILSKCCSALLLGALALLVWRETLAIHYLYPLGFGLGMAGALGIPASAALLPNIVSQQHLVLANTSFMGLNQLAGLVGPILAGLLIAFFYQQPETGSHLRGICIALVFDAVSFLVSAWTLSRIVSSTSPATTAMTPGRSGLLAELRFALAHLWSDRSLRACCLYWCAIAFCMGGPIQVALPILASTRLEQGVTGLGIMLAAHGAGVFIGMLLANTGSRWRVVNLGTTLLLIDALIGMFIMPLGFTHQAWQAACLLLSMGACTGYLQIGIYSWVQRRIPPALLGRAMSLFTFMLMVMSPISVMLTGGLLRLMGTGPVFAASGCTLIGIAAIAFSRRHIGNITDISDASVTKR